MDDLKFNRSFQELTESESESIEGGWIFGRIMNGFSNGTNGIFNMTVDAFEAVDRSIGAVLNAPATIIRWFFRV